MSGRGDDRIEAAPVGGAPADAVLAADIRERFKQLRAAVGRARKHGLRVRSRDNREVLSHLDDIGSDDGSRITIVREL